MRAMLRLGTHTVKPVGVGSLSVTCAALRGLDVSDVTRALHEAIELGLDLVEVSAEEAAERLVGDAIRSLRVRDRVVGALRVPALVERLGVPTRDVLPERLPARYVQDRVEAALRTTRLDVLPLAQLGLRAAWRTSTAWPELEGTCARLVREGKVLEWGAFVETIEDDTAELAQPPFISIAVPFNLCERAAEPVLAAAAERSIAVLARRPLAGAALAGALGPGVQLRLHDDRRAFDAHQLERIAVGVAKLAAHVKDEPSAARSSEAAKHQLERNARPEEIHCTTVAELALRWVIARGAIALPRLHRSEHVAEAVAIAAAPPLPPLDLDI